MKNNNKKIALNRIKILFKQAIESFKDYPERAHRYVQLARKISMSMRFPIFQ